MRPDRLNEHVSRFAQRLAEEVTALVVLSDPELVQVDRMLRLKRGSRR